MQPVAVRLILDEHQALATVVRALGGAVERARKLPEPPRFDEMRAMLFYLDEMPAHHHHAYESELLFPRIRGRCPALRPVLDRLEAEHGSGEFSVRELEYGLLAWEVMGDKRREAFELVVRSYSASYLGHIEVEENYILPVAMDYLSAADWRELEEAFGRQRGVLTDSSVQVHRQLYERIVAARAQT